MRLRSLWAPRRLVPAGILLLTVVVVALLFWPGHMNADSIEEAGQARNGFVTDLHAGLLIKAWHLVWPLGVGPGWILVGQLACFVTGTFLVLHLAFRPLWAALITVAISFSPPIFGALPLVGRDMWFMGFMVLAFGLLGGAAKRDGRARTWWLAGSLAAIWLSLAARQNAAPAAAIASIGVAGLALRRLRPSGGRGATYFGRGAVAALVGLLLTVAFMFSQTLLSRAAGVIRVHPEQYTFIQDLSALSVQEDRDVFPTSVMPRASLANLKHVYSMEDGITSVAYYSGAPVTVPLTGAQYSALRHAWLHKVKHSPFEYLGMRWKLFLRQIALDRNARWVYHPGIDPNALGYKTRFPKLDRAAVDYLNAFTGPNLDGTLVHRVWIYLLIAGFGVVVLLRRSRGAPLIVLGALALSAWTFQIGVFFGAPSPRFRFEEPAVLIGLITGVVLIKLGFDALRIRRARARALA